jgi:hypothetical protein
MRRVHQSGSLEDEQSIRIKTRTGTTNKANSTKASVVLTVSSPFDRFPCAPEGSALCREPHYPQLSHTPIDSAAPEQ